MMNYEDKLSEGTKVRLLSNNKVIATGTIRGFFSQWGFEVQNTLDFYIVEIDGEVKNYPYSCTVIFSSFVEEIR